MGIGGSNLGVGCGEDSTEHSPGGGKPEKKGGKNEKKDHRERRKEISNSQTLTNPQSQGGQGAPARSSWSTTASEVNPASLGRYRKMDFQAQRAQETERSVVRPWPGGQTRLCWPHSSVQHPRFWMIAHTVPPCLPRTLFRSPLALRTYTRSVGSSAFCPQGCPGKVPQTVGLKQKSTPS